MIQELLHSRPSMTHPPRHTIQALLEQIGTVAPSSPEPVDSYEPSGWQSNSTVVPGESYAQNQMRPPADSTQEGTGHTEPVNKMDVEMKAWQKCLTDIDRRIQDAKDHDGVETGEQHLSLCNLYDLRTQWSNEDPSKRPPVVDEKTTGRLISTIARTSRKST